MKLNGYQIICEMTNHPIENVSLPPDLLEFMLTPQYNNYNNFKIKTEEDIPKLHIEALNEIKKWHESNGGDIKKDLQLIHDKKLHFIKFYINGDFAAISLIDNHIYDWNHDLNTFNVLHPDAHHPQFKPLHYKEWMKLIQHDKHIDAWDY
jgi:hypothetical protein